MNYLLREIKLSKLANIPLNDDTSKLVKFWNDLWIDMKVRVDPTKCEIKCWKDEYDQYYFRQDDKDDYLWCDYDEVWSFFRHDLGLNYNETQRLIQYMVDETLNYMINTPNWNMDEGYVVVDESLNCVLNTPIVVHTPIKNLVVETLKCVINTPETLAPLNYRKVVETLICEINNTQD